MKVYQVQKGHSSGWITEHWSYTFSYSFLWLVGTNGERYGVVKRALFFGVGSHKHSSNNKKA